MRGGLVSLRSWLFEARFSFLDPWIVWVRMVVMFMVKFSFPLVRTFPIMLFIHVSFMMPWIIMMIKSIAMTMVWAYSMMIVMRIVLTFKVFRSKSVMDEIVWVLILVMLPFVVMAIMMKIVIILKMLISMVVSMVVSMMISVVVTIMTSMV